MKPVYTFSQRLVPPFPVSCSYIGRFCKNSRGQTGIVQGRKLVLDTRPGREKFLRHQYYGISYIFGRQWNAFDPKPLSTGELQKITWAWGANSEEDMTAGRIAKRQQVTSNAE